MQRIIDAPNRSWSNREAKALAAVIDSSPTKARHSLRSMTRNRPMTHACTPFHGTICQQFARIRRVVHYLSWRSDVCVAWPEMGFQRTRRYIHHVDMYRTDTTGHSRVAAARVNQGSRRISKNIEETWTNNIDDVGQADPCKCAAIRQATCCTL